MSDPEIQTDKQDRLQTPRFKPVIKSFEGVPSYEKDRKPFLDSFLLSLQKQLPLRHRLKYRSYPCLVFLVGWLSFLALTYLFLYSVLNEPFLGPG